MFAQKIQSLQQRILELEQQQAKYKNLEQEANAVLASIAKLHHAAAELDEQATIEQMVAEVIGYSVGNATEEPAPEELQPENYEEVVERITLETIATVIEDEVVEEVETNLERYLDPKTLQEVLNGDDPELALMEVASLLDTSHQDDVKERLRYFVEKLPSELCDRLLGYLPKSIGLQWVQTREKVEEDARASLFPPAEQPATTYEPAIDDMVECLSNGMVGRITYICDAPEGKKATVLVPGGASNFHVSNLKYIGKFEGEKPEDAPNSNHAVNETSTNDEMDQLARQCLGLRSWSQMRIFADSNPAVITRMQEIASTKAELRVINNLPSLVIGYIQRANDRTDLEWLPEPVLSEVEALLGQTEVQAIA